MENEFGSQFQSDFFHRALKDYIEALRRFSEKRHKKNKLLSCVIETSKI